MGKDEEEELEKASQEDLFDLHFLRFFSAIGKSL